MTGFPAKITAALHEVMEKVGYVQKTGENKFHRYTYASEADLLQSLRPAMVQAGLMLIPSAKERSTVDEHGNTHVVVEYTLLHKDGDVWPEKILAFGSGNDKSSKGGIGDKGTYKALTGANKYLLFKLFQVATGDDPEMEVAGPEPQGQPEAEVSEEAKQRAWCQRFLGRDSIDVGNPVNKIPEERQVEILERLIDAAQTLEVLHRLKEENSLVLDGLALKDEDACIRLSESYRKAEQEIQLNNSLAA